MDVIGEEHEFADSPKTKMKQRQEWTQGKEKLQ